MWSQPPGILRHPNIFALWHWVFWGPLPHVHSVVSQLEYCMEHSSSSAGSTGPDGQREEPGDLVKTSCALQQQTQSSSWGMPGEMHFHCSSCAQRHQNMKKGTSKRDGYCPENKMKARYDTGILKWREVMSLKRINRAG